MRYPNPFKYKYALWRKLPSGKWFVVGRKSAIAQNQSFYVKEGTVSCKRRHLSPIYVGSNYCKKCVDLGHCKSDNKTLSIDLNPLDAVDMTPIVNYWRDKLLLPLPDSGLFYNVFIIDSKLYYNIKLAAKAHNICDSTVHNRCISKDYKWINYVVVKVPRFWGKLYNA